MKALDLPFSAAARRRAQASWWFARLQEAELPSALLPRWKKWIADPENRNVFDQIVRLNALLRRMNPQPAVALQSPPGAGEQLYDGAISVRAWVRARGLDREGPRRWRLATACVALAAALGLVAVGLQWLQPSSWRSTEAAGSEGMSVLKTEIAEHKNFVLSDNSMVSLGAKSAATVEITAQSRTVVLNRGEALFQVVRDPSRPFRVIAGGGTITAIGTAFAVRRRDDDHVIVTVTEGKVEVAAVNVLAEHDVVSDADLQQAALRSLQLVRGQELSYDPQGRFSEVRRADEDALSSWESGRLRYRGEPLRNVIQDVNRYSRKPLILGDKAAGDLRYSGTVFERDVDDWIAALPRIFPEVEVTEIDTDHVLVRTRGETAQRP